MTSVSSFAVPAINELGIVTAAAFVVVASCAAAALGVDVDVFPALLSAEVRHCKFLKYTNYQSGEFYTYKIIHSSIYATFPDITFPIQEALAMFRPSTCRQQTCVHAMPVEQFD